MSDMFAHERAMFERQMEPLRLLRRLADASEKQVALLEDIKALLLRQQPEKGGPPPSP